MRRTSYTENLFRDLHYAVRILCKAPAFTLAAIATLTLGIGAHTAIFQLFDAVRLRTLPVPQPHRLAQIQVPNMNFGILEGTDNLSYPLYQEIRAYQHAFSDLFAWNSGCTTLRLGQGEETRQVSVLAVTGRKDISDSGGAELSRSRVRGGGGGRKYPLPPVASRRAARGVHTG